MEAEMRARQIMPIQEVSQPYYEESQAQNASKNWPRETIWTSENWFENGPHKGQLFNLAKIPYF